jgi:hypothetical protein
MGTLKKRAYVETWTGTEENIWKVFNKYGLRVRNQFKVFALGKEYEYGNKNNIPYEMGIY